LSVHVPHFQPGVKVIRSAPGETRAEWAEAIGGFDPSTAQVLKADGDTAVYRAKILGRDVVLKRWDLSTRGARAKAMFAASRGHRHWRGAARLARAGIRTARCLVLAFEQRDVPRVWLAMERLDGHPLLEHMANPDPSVRTQHAIASAAGALVAAFCRTKLHNRDLKPSNLILLPGPAPTLAVVDCVAIRRKHRGELLTMLASLVIEPAGCGVMPRAALRARALRACLDGLGPIKGPAGDPRVLRHVIAARYWMLVARAVTSHGDPRPKVNPLAPPASANS
jgi:hypothetical protein